MFLSIWKSSSATHSFVWNFIIFASVNSKREQNGTSLKVQASPDSLSWTCWGASRQQKTAKKGLSPIWEKNERFTFRRSQPLSNPFLMWRPFFFIYERLIYNRALFPRPWNGPKTRVTIPGTHFDNWSLRSSCGNNVECLRKVKKVTPSTTERAVAVLC